jgi:hypothetical protein
MNIDKYLGLRAFYKGTSLQAPVIKSAERDFYEVVIKEGEAQIVSFLREGNSLSQVKAILKGQMDLMEDGLYRTQNAFEVGKECDQDAWMAMATAGTEMEGPGHTNVIIWFMNIAALLKLGVIANDDNNGWWKMSAWRS